MIRTETEYKAAVGCIEKDKIFLQQQREAFEKEGLTPEAVAYTLQPTISFHKQLEEEVKSYEQTRRKSKSFP